jgi:hypothetical protein
LPDVQSRPDKIADGSVTATGFPKTETKAGEVPAALSFPGDGFTVKPGGFSGETVPPEGISVDEAEREGFATPGSCLSGFLCGNIETRLDFAAYAFKYEEGVPVARSGAEREAYLREKVERLCPSCPVRKDAG